MQNQETAIQSEIDVKQMLTDMSAEAKAELIQNLKGQRGPIHDDLDHRRKKPDKEKAKDRRHRSESLESGRPRGSRGKKRAAKSPKQAVFVTVVSILLPFKL